MSTRAAVAGRRRGFRRALGVSTAAFLAAPLLAASLAVACAPAPARSGGSDGVAASLQEVLRTRENRPEPTQLDPERARRLRGVYVDGDRWVELYGTGGLLYLRTDGVAAAPLVERGDDLDAWAPGGRRISVADLGDGVLAVDGERLRRRTTRPAVRPGSEWRDLIGHYALEGAADSVTLILHERRGRPYIEIGDVLLCGGDWSGGRIVLDQETLTARDLLPVRGDTGTSPALRLGGLVWKRTPVGTPEGETFRIEPVAPIEQLRAAALAAEPPHEEGGLRDPDLVEVTNVEPGIRLDIRYAGADNFLGTPVYQQARAFLQRPAAAAVARAHRALAVEGFGLLIHDAYRPWYVTKIFWDATPEGQKQFVADPASGSRHNRGAAVDLTLYDLATGDAVGMPGGYDEFSERSYPDYPGGTSIQRWRRDLLRRAMEAEGFDVYEFEWWHFDYRDWRRYPVLDRTFAELAGERR